MPCSDCDSLLWHLLVAMAVATVSAQVQVLLLCKEWSCAERTCQAGRIWEESLNNP